MKTYFTNIIVSYVYEGPPPLCATIVPTKQGWDISNIQHMWKRCKTHTKYRSESLTGRDYSEDLVVDGKIILDWILRK
jgi:hypothetical protein